MGGLLQKFIDDFTDGGRLLTEARNFVDAMPICGPNAFWLDAIWHEMQHSAHVCNLFLGDGYFFGGLVHASQMNSDAKLVMDKGYFREDVIAYLISNEVDPLPE